MFASSTEEYCRTFDLTCRIPSSIVEGALQTGDHIRLDVDSPESELSTRRIIRRIKDIFNTEGEASSKPLRICIPSLGSPQWGDLNPQVVLKQFDKIEVQLIPLAGDIMVLAFAATAGSPIPACMCQFIPISSSLHRCVGWFRLGPETRVACRWSY